MASILCIYRILKTFLRKKLLPLWKRIIKPIKDKDFKFLFHSDGKLADLLPIVINELKADGINPIERNILIHFFLEMSIVR